MAKQDITLIQAHMMISLHKLRSATAFEVGQPIGRTAAHVNGEFRKLVEKGFVRRSDAKNKATGGRGAWYFQLRDDLAAMGDAEFTPYITGLVNPKNMQAIKPTASTPRSELLARNPEYAELLRLNAPYLSCFRLAEVLGERTVTVKEMAVLLGISVGEDELEPRADDISSELRFIPNGSRINEWIGGTSIHLPSPLPGINSVIRHYGAE